MIWETEPDAWDAELMCARRNHAGSWCGYVGVPENHPLYSKAWDDYVEVPQSVLERDIDLRGPRTNIFGMFTLDPDKVALGQLPISLALECHGGITFTGGDGEFPRSDPGIWWLGFDCSHAGDLAPKYAEMSGLDDGVYRSLEYVKLEILHLAKQIARWQIGAP